MKKFFYIFNEKPTHGPTHGPTLELTPQRTPVHPYFAAAQDSLKRYLDSESRIALMSSCALLYKVYKPDDVEMVKALATRVLWNRPGAVTQILEAAKDDTEKLKRLLTNSVTLPVTLPSGLLFKGFTPFQAALCTWNTALCEEFKKYFAQIPNGLAIMQGQITQIFPEGVEAYIEKQKADAEAFKDKTLKPLIATIRDARDEDVKTMQTEKQSDSELGQAIAAFRESIKTLSGNKPVHNPFYLQAGFDLYLERHNSFNSPAKKHLFCVQVIGGIQRHSPAYDLQAFAQGLLGLVQDGKLHQGSFKFSRQVANVTRLEINVRNGLGYEYCVGTGFPGAAGEWLCYHVQAQNSTALFQVLYQAKTAGITNFCAGSRATSSQFHNGM